MAYRLSFADIHSGVSNIVLTGIPKEGTGASNDAKGSMGPPKFKDAKFQLVSDTTLTIKINY